MKETLKSVYGVYKDGQVMLDESIDLDHAMRVIVTFLDDTPTQKPTNLTWNDFNFDKVQQLTKDIKGSLSDLVVDERRNCVI